MFGTEHCIKLELRPIDFRVPKKNDLYVGKDNLLHRCKKTNFSKNAQRRLIVKEDWKQPLGKLK
jgi:hypothetical protein